MALHRSMVSRGLSRAPEGLLHAMGLATTSRGSAAER